MKTKLDGKFPQEIEFHHIKTDTCGGRKSKIVQATSHTRGEREREYVYLCPVEPLVQWLRVSLSFAARRRFTFRPLASPVGGSLHLRSVSNNISKQSIVPATQTLIIIVLVISISCSHTQRLSVF